MLSEASFVSPLEFHHLSAATEGSAVGWQKLRRRRSAASRRGGLRRFPRRGNLLPRTSLYLKFGLPDKTKTSATVKRLRHIILLFIFFNDPDSVLSGRNEFFSRLESALRKCRNIRRVRIILRLETERVVLVESYAVLADIVL